jgi:CRP-like cAMP-binding protein
MRADPEVAWLLLRRLAGRVRTLVEQLDRLAARDVGARLAEYLLARAPEDGGAALTLGAPQARVAEELGTVREVLVRELRQFRAEGLLRSAGRGRYEIVDRGALEARAGLARGPLSRGQST